MDVANIKSDLHRIIDELDNEKLLQSLHDLLKFKAKEEPGRLWNTLSYQQREEILSALSESEEESRLIPWS